MRGSVADLDGTIDRRPGGDVRDDAAMEVSQMQTPVERPPSFRGWRPEAARLLRFGVVGVAATVTHYAIALSLVAVAGLPAQIAHVAGFLGAAPVSFFGHYHWTFRSRAGYGRAALRFVGIALGAFLVSMALLEALERLTAWRAAASLFASVLVIPIASYVLNRAFVFRAPGTRRAP
jgi:putative flippase GtrA